MNITKLYLAKILSKNLNIDTKESSELVNSFFLNIKLNLSNKDVKIHKFGVLQKKTSPKRVGRNPKTMEIFEIKSREKIYFKASNLSKKFLNDA